ncbi:PREDICTED: uncharacterized protein LOC109221839 [Nicotiana attenuata]|uniref:uncharacterized protein LOC109221839 n=1 Tax=Nicotiana attenuata TaxID=49451 RepID=UPI0009057809|nr:PREDICTED: uncharacterized protein LOC109221839 [Nicotiana attenuata]
MEAAGTSKIIGLHELEEFRFQAFESARLYKERMKLMYDKHILDRNFKPGDLVLLCNSRLRLFPEDGTNKFTVNGQRLKQYLGMAEEKGDRVVITLEEPQYANEE